MKSELRLDYSAALRPLSGAPLAIIIERIRGELPAAWIARYHRMCEGPTNVLEVTLHDFVYLFDYCTELIDSGDLLVGAREDRTIAAYGTSQSKKTPRNATRIKCFPGSDSRGDRGHLIAHSAGGGLDINVFHQDVYLNRGWSPSGKRYREMERYCASHAGTFFFSRLIYADATARPAEIEFAILKPDGTLWVEIFANSSAA